MYLGIDLGTSNSAIAGNIDAQIRLFKASDGSDVFPSVIYIDRRGHRLYGKRAYEQTLLSPDNVAKGFKRLMGTSSVIRFQTSEQTMTPEECSAEILRQLVSQAILETNSGDIKGVAVTIPAAFNQMQSEATVRAANAAGLENVVLLQEPIAAAMAAMAQTKNRSGQFLVYDLGGGTFDLALVQSLSGSVNIIGHEGINMLGGQDFDRVLINSVVRPWLVDKFALPVDFQKDDRYRRLIGKALIAAERAKIDLSSADKATIFGSDEDIQVRDDNGNEIYIDINVTRSQLEELLNPLLVQTIELSRAIIKNNGYGNQDIDRIVFVGGPSKMPWIRERLPRELGIASDTSIDPMTAVAIGAAIYAESREWGASTTKRKATRASITTGRDTGLKFDYPARVTADFAKLRLKADPKAVTMRLSIQIDDLEGGWTSGRVAIVDEISIDLPVKAIGENRFKISLFDADGLPSAEAPNVISITRTHATAAAIPASQTISVKVRAGVTRVRNVLEPILDKGTPLPANGSKEFKAAYGIDAAMPGHIDLELFQDEGVQDPELNLNIGAFRVSHHDLPEGMAIKEGDSVVFHWSMSESGLLTASVELPSVRQTFATKRFYVDQAGHQSFDGDDGARLVEARIALAETEAAGILKAVGTSAQTDVETIERKLEDQRRRLRESSTGDERRSITESVRHIRQEVARIRMKPENRARVLEHRLAERQKAYNELARPAEPSPESQRFDHQAEAAANEFKRGTPAALDMAEAIIEQMDGIYWRAMWQKPEFVLYMFEQVSLERHLAVDKATFDLLLADGRGAITANDVDELRMVVVRIAQDQVASSAATGDVAKLASVLRG